MVFILTASPPAAGPFSRLAELFSLFVLRFCEVANLDLGGAVVVWTAPPVGLPPRCRPLGLRDPTRFVFLYILIRGQIPVASKSIPGRWGGTSER